ncbi:MAG TPA: aldehyde oxidase, partial [Anaerolineae bacterium]|nr:aldehyde oxidase [Anaerolineae bacterium]
MPNSVIGKSHPRVDAQGKVTGETLYSGDLTRQRMLHMKILMAERPHARVKKINLSKALASEGVVAIFTAKDVPNNEYGLQIPDQPVFCGPDANKPYTDIVRFVGDQIAAVVANTEHQAHEAMKLIEVDYEDLPPLTDPITAMRADAVLLHPDRGDTNICVHYKIRKGDVEDAFAKADVIVEAEY